MFSLEKSIIILVVGNLNATTCFVKVVKVHLCCIRDHFLDAFARKINCRVIDARTIRNARKQIIETSNGIFYQSKCNVKFPGDLIKLFKTFGKMSKRIANGRMLWKLLYLWNSIWSVAWISFDAVVPVQASFARLLRILTIFIFSFSSYWPTTQFLFGLILCRRCA